jgi:outer membrane lipase/esterase
MMRHRIATLVAASTIALAAPALAQTSAGATASNAPVTRVIVFGDSLADGGYYLPLDPRIPRDAGSFTTNPDPVAPEVFAARLGIDLQPVYGRGGTNYAIGGARVTAPNGITIPIATQVSNFLATGSFGPRDLVYIQGGGNDFFAFQALGGRDNTILTNAATQLAGAVSRIQNAGAQRIVTLAVQTGGNVGLQVFNATFASALAAANVNALYFDTDKLFNEIVADRVAFGITNVTGQACTVASSLNCNRSTLVTPNANETYLLADSVHPAGVTQRIQGQAIASMVQAPEQIAGLAYAAQALFRSQRDLFEGAERGTVARDGGRLAVFGGVGYHYHSRDGGAQRIGLAQRGVSGTLGVDLALTDTTGIGVAGGYSDVKGDFAAGQGGYDSEAWSGSAYARLGVGPVRLLVDGTYGEIANDDIRRRAVLGLTTRESIGETDGDYRAARATLGADLLTAGGLALGPDVAVAYERLTLDAYAERGTRSTDAAFGRQRIKSLTGRFGAAVHSTPDNLVRFAARAGYEREFDDDARAFTITPASAPISYTTTVDRADRDYLSFAATADGSMGSGLSVRGGVSGQVLRRDMDNVTAFAGLSLAF